MRRVDGNQCFPDRESRACIREPDLHHRRGAFRDQQVAKQVAVAFGERDRLEVPVRRSLCTRPCRRPPGSVGPDFILLP